MTKEERLRKVIEELESYANETSCGWCGSKARKVADFVRELEEVGPIAKEMSDKIDALRGESIDKEIAKMRAMRGVVAPPEPTPPPPPKRRGEPIKVPTILEMIPRPLEIIRGFAPRGADRRRAFRR